MSNAIRITITAYPRDKRIHLIKAIREYSGLGLAAAKMLTDALPFDFFLNTQGVDEETVVQILDSELRGLGVVYHKGEQTIGIREEDLVQAMVIADDQQTGFERCRHMLRAALEQKTLLGKPLLVYHENDGQRYYYTPGND